MRGGRVDRVATIPATATGGQDSLIASDYAGFAMTICGYRCAMAGGPAPIYRPPQRFVGRACTDLVSGRKFEALPAAIAMVPLESMVLVLE